MHKALRTMDRIEQDARRPDLWRIWWRWADGSVRPGCAYSSPEAARQAAITITRADATGAASTNPSRSKETI